MLEKINNWLTDRYYDCYFWFKDKPLQKFTKGLMQRTKNVGVCLWLLVLAVYSTARFRIAIIDLSGKIK